MTPDQFLKAIKIFNEAIDAELEKRDLSLREFAIEFGEHVSDLVKWKGGKKALNPRIIVKVCRLFNIKPHDLNPDHFPHDLAFVFDNAAKPKIKRRTV